MATAEQILMTAAVMFVVCGASAAWAGDLPVAKSSQATVVTATDERQIVVSLEDRKLALLENGQVVKVYSVAVGKPSTPSPVGTFTIERRVANPTYHHDGKTIPPGPGNPVGTRWMGLSIRGYGIHGTNEPKSIGKAASHGCIRMAKADLEELYPLVEVGDTVEFVGHRDEETARLFGGDVTPAPQGQPLQASNPPSVATPVAANNAQPSPATTRADKSSVEAAALAVFTGAL